MKIKKIIILALFLSLLLIGSVNASSDADQTDENSADTLKAENLNLNSSIDNQDSNSIDDERNEIELAAERSDETLAASQDNNPITAKDYSQLYSQITNLKSQSSSRSATINLNPKGDFTITDTIVWGSAKSSVRVLTINGNGATIDGKGSKCFLTVQSGYTITLNDLNVANNYRYNDGGGSICVNEGGELHVNGCSFTNCRTPNINENVHGGAIRGGFNAKIYIDNSVFKSNYASFGGGAVVIGASVSDVALNMDSNTDASTIAPTLIISNSQFIDNRAGHGGAINIEDYCAAVITNCTFRGNVAFDSKVGLGGGICTDEASYLISKDNTFQNNTAMASGGGIYNAPRAPLIIEDNTFINNQASEGGGLCNVNGLTLTLTNSIFAGNNAKNIGGAMHNTDGAVILISNSTFTNNTAGSGGAISNLPNNRITISGCAFDSNGATKFGGALQFAENSNVLIEDTNLTDNTATTNGGAICIGKNTNVTAENTVFATNKANMGGAVNVEDNSRLTSHSTIFEKNNAVKSGGAIYLGQNTDIASTNTTFIKNTADELGGAICGNANSRIAADGTVFAQNNAAKNGGAIYSSKNNVRLRNCELTANTVTTNGGAVYAGQSTVMIATGTAFNENSADGFGGAICSVGESNVTLVNSAFDNNDASRGNALYNPGQCTLTFKGTTFVDSEDYYNTGVLKIEETINTKLSIDSIDYSSELVIEGRLVDEYGFPISDETVSVSLENLPARAQTDYKGGFTVIYDGIVPGTYKIDASYANGNSVYNPSTTSITKRIAEKKATILSAEDVTTTFNVNKNMVITLKDSQNNPVAGVQISVDLGSGAKYYPTDSNGQVKVSTGGLIPNAYSAKISFNGNDDYRPSNTTAKITVNKDATKFTATDMTTVYNVNKDLVIILKDNQNNPVANVQISVDLGTGVKYYLTGSNGQVKVSTSGLAPRTYNAKISFSGNYKYDKSTATAKVVVKKATPKMTAKAKTFKKSVKTKKYSITLKNNLNKVMKNAKVTIKVNKKTYSAKTNAKGVATFKITKLTKKGKYTATVTFNGDAYYNKLTKKVKITVK